MTYRWLTDLASWLRVDPVVAPRIIEWPGWQTRGRPADQFDFEPDGLLAHHTACMILTGHDPANCVNVIIAGNTEAPGPISQVLTTWTRPGVKWTGGNLDPHVVVIAAGRCNHAGGGRYSWRPESGNRWSIGEESCGPPAGGWPDAMIEFRARVNACILRGLGFGVDRLMLHGEYKTDGSRIDPSGAWYRQPTLRQLGMWSPAAWRGEVARFIASPNPQPPQPIPEDPDMIPFVRDPASGAIYDVDGVWRVYHDQDSWTVEEARGRRFVDLDGAPLDALRRMPDRPTLVERKK